MKVTLGRARERLKDCKGGDVERELGSFILKARGPKWLRAAKVRG